MPSFRYAEILPVERSSLLALTRKLEKVSERFGNVAAVGNGACIIRVLCNCTCTMCLSYSYINLYSPTTVVASKSEANKQKT